MESRNMATISNPLAGRATRERDIGYDHRREAGQYISDLRVKRGLSQFPPSDTLRWRTPWECLARLSHV